MMLLQGTAYKENDMESEWRVRTEYSFSNTPAYQVYRLKDESKDDTRENREVIGNFATKEYAEFKAKEKNNMSNRWHANSPVWHPPYQTMCQIHTRDGRELEAQLIHLNPQYHQKVNPDVWRVEKHNYIDDDDVVEWRQI